MDVIMVSQAGLTEVVGSLGTSVTASHLQKLRRVVPRVIAMFDGDPAGEKAALRMFELFPDTAFSGEVCLLPNGEDPDSFSRRVGTEGLEEFLQRSQPLLDFYLSHLKKQSESYAGKATSVREIVGLIAKVRDPIEQDLMIQKTADVLGVREELLRSQLCNTSQIPAPGLSVSPAADALDSPAERTIVQLMLHRPHLIPLVEASEVLDLFESSEWRDIASELMKLRQTTPVDTRHLLSNLPEDALQRVSRLLIVEEKLDCSPEHYLEDCIKRVRMTNLERREEGLRSRLKEAGREGEPLVKDVLREWTQVKAQQRNLIQSS
jgi:DNA primase